MGWHDDRPLTSVDAGGSHEISGDQIAGDVSAVVYRYGVPRHEKKPRQMAQPKAMETRRFGCCMGAGEMYRSQDWAHISTNAGEYGDTDRPFRPAVSTDQEDETNQGSITKN